MTPRPVVFAGRVVGAARCVARRIRAKRRSHGFATSCGDGARIRTKLMKRVALSLSLAAALVAVGAVLPIGAVSLPAGMTAVPLVAITNDRDTSISEIQLMLGPQKLVRGLYIATYDNERDPGKSEGQVIPLASLEDPEGAVVGQGRGVKAILLKGKIEPKAGSGTLEIKYITDGLFGRYSECEVHLRKTGPDQWQLINAYTHGKIRHIHVKTWALGISTLENVCPTGKA
ncbi:MAG: hypothetical protein ACREP2_06665 [Rhodanobacteraceae bacterium]